MTRLSALVGGASALEYISGNLYPARGLSVGSALMSTNTDYIFPWAPRKLLTVDKVAWYRDAGTAANVYVGLYNSAGTLLTDCAVDSDTTTGWHAVDTTNVTLSAGQVYYLAANVSGDVMGTWSLTNQTSAGNMSSVYADQVTDYGHNLTIGSAPGTATLPTYSKARTNAALLSSLTMSGWSDSTSGIAPVMGVVAA